MKTVNISGKPYVPVNERLKEFRENPKYEGYRLVTELVDVNADHALIKASIINPKDEIIAQGTAFEVAGSSFINKGSHVENAETSAWGRALGNFGIGIDASVATADEVANAVANQDNPRRKPPEEATEDQLKEILQLTNDLGGTLLQVYQTYKINGRPSKAKADEILTALKTKKATLAKELDSHS